MAQLIVRLTESGLVDIERELHAYEQGTGLELKDIGCDEDGQNYGIYHESFFLPEGAIALRPPASVPPDPDAVQIEKGPMFIGGVKQELTVWRLPGE